MRLPLKPTTPAKSQNFELNLTCDSDSFRGVVHRQSSSWLYSQDRRSASPQTSHFFDTSCQGDRFESSFSCGGVGVAVAVAVEALKVCLIVMLSVRIVSDD